MYPWELTLILFFLLFGHYYWYFELGYIGFTKCVGILNSPPCLTGLQGPRGADWGLRVAGPKLSHLRPGSFGSGRGSRAQPPAPSDRRATGQGASPEQAHFTPFYQILIGAPRWEPQLSTRFLALISKWKSEQEQINTGAELFGSQLEASHPLPLSLRLSFQASSSSPRLRAFNRRCVPFRSPKQLYQAACKRGAESSSRRGSTSGDRSEARRPAAHD